LAFGIGVMINRDSARRQHSSSSQDPPPCSFPSSLRFLGGFLLLLSSVPFRRASSPEMANARSGVAVNDECMLKFGELQSKRLHRFITYKMDDKFKEIVVDQVGDRATSYEDFTNSLPENDCRYAIYDFDFVTAEDVQKSRIFYILWSPDSAKVKSKMLYASSNQKFKSGLNGIQVELQATDASEISIDQIKDRAR